jgi:hypothetical protein
MTDDMLQCFAGRRKKASDKKKREQNFGINAVEE